MNTKKKGIIAIMIALVLAVVATVLVIKLTNNAIVYESVGLPDAKCVIKNDKMSVSFDYHDGYFAQTIGMSGKFERNGDYYRLDVDTSHVSLSYFDKEMMDLNDAECPVYTGFINDKVIYNPFQNNYLIKKGVKTTDDKVLAILSNYRAQNVTDVDMFINLSDEIDDVKENIANTLIVLTGDLEENELITGGATAINSITEDGQPFAITAGKHNITVTYDTNKTVDMVVLVGEDKDNDANKTLSIKVDSLNYDLGEGLRVEKGTTKEDFVANKEIKLKLDGEYVDLTVDMINGFDTSKTGTKIYSISYKGVTERDILRVYDPDSDTIEIIDVDPTFEPTILKGQDLSFNIKIKHDNTEEPTEELIPITTDGVNIKGFDKNKTGRQFITIEYKGASMEQVIVVYDADFNPEIYIDDYTPNITIKNGQIFYATPDLKPIISFKKADGASTTPVAITLDMIQNLDLNAKKDGDYYGIYKTQLGDYYFHIEITFTE